MITVQIVVVINTPFFCAECSPGLWLFMQGCVKSCPPGFTPGLQLLNLSLENWVEQSSVQACLVCHPACLTCSGPGEAECQSCPPHRHLVGMSCLHQNQVQRKSPISPVHHSEGVQGADSEIPKVETSSHLPVLVAMLSCAFILATFAAIFVLLQLHSGAANARFCRRTKLQVTDSSGRGVRVGFGFGFGLGRDLTNSRVLYRGIPTAWRDEDTAAGVNSESENEELDFQSEKTAFIQTQSGL